MKIGYARVSMQEQHLDLQLDALREEGCEKIYQEYASGGNTARPELARALEHLRKDDTLVIWKLDRLGRSLRHLIDVVTMLMGKGMGLKSLQDPIDTTTAQGRFVFNVFASLAEFERDLIRERTKAGLQAARARGRRGGRPKGLTAEAEEKALAAETLYREGRLSANQVARRLGIAKSTLYKYLRHRGVEISAYKKQPKRAPQPKPHQKEKREIMQRTSIRVGQRLINWDGTRGYVGLNSQGKRVFGAREPFLVEWLGFDGKTAEDAAYSTLEDLKSEGVTFGKGVMPWAK